MAENPYDLMKHERLTKETNGDILGVVDDERFRDLHSEGRVSYDLKPRVG